MRTRILLLIVCLGLFACNPYKGFKGVNNKGMKSGITPSQELRDDYDKSSKRMKKSYKREMKKRKRRLGTNEK